GRAGSYVADPGGGLFSACVSQEESFARARPAGPVSAIGGSGTKRRKISTSERHSDDRRRGGELRRTTPEPDCNRDSGDNRRSRGASGVAHCRGDTASRFLA